MNIKRLLISITIALIVFTVFYSSTTYALSDIITSARSFLSASSDDDGAVSTTAVKGVSDTIYKILLGTGVAVAVIIGAALGIQFIFGSVEGKAKIMEALVPYIVGCVVVFGAFTIWGFAIRTGNSISGTAIPMSEVRGGTSEINERVARGEIGSFSDDELRGAYRRNNIDGTLNEAVNGTRNPNRVSLQQAINNLGSENKTIYNECKNRGLLQDNGIWLK